VQLKLFRCAEHTLQKHQKNSFQTLSYQVLVDSRDFRQIDVGVLSKRPITGLRSHVDDVLPGKKKKAKKKTTEGSKYLFSRDCLEVDIALPGDRTLTVFNNHFKSKFAMTPEERIVGVSSANFKRKP
jgi:hypothetical protein